MVLDPLDVVSRFVGECHENSWIERGAIPRTPWGRLQVTIAKRQRS